MQYVYKLHTIVDEKVENVYNAQSDIENILEIGYYVYTASN